MNCTFVEQCLHDAYSNAMMQKMPIDGAAALPFGSVVCFCLRDNAQVKLVLIFAPSPAATIVFYYIHFCFVQQMATAVQQPEHKDSCCSHDEEDLEHKVEHAIKALPTLQEKVQAIALNGYLQQKK